MSTRLRGRPITITCKPGDRLDHIADGTIDLVVMDPPYYDNVMYAELSDFFYVWLKRTAGHVFPELFRSHLTDKDNEAVANPARFRDQKGAKALAERDYQERMASIFAECRRTLKADGLMTLMFTHKATGAWDALTKGLMDAGFAITASWPINTEAEGSMHIKDKAAAKSTIFLVCRPRVSYGESAGGQGDGDSVIRETSVRCIGRTSSRGLPAPCASAWQSFRTPASPGWICISLPSDRRWRSFPATGHCGAAPHATNPSHAAVPNGRSTMRHGIRTR